VLRGILGPKREEEAGDWIRLHKEEPYNLYAPQNIIRVIKSRRMRWAGHVARIGKVRNAYKSHSDCYFHNKALPGGINIIMHTFQY
jgi:hypothetical protein